jgi:MraZ protein
MPAWIAFEERLAKVSQFDPTVAAIRRIYVSGAVECDLDKLGRILIPAVLRNHADFGRKVLWAGMGDYVELWSKPRFDALRNDILDDEEKRHAMAQRLAELGL